MQIDFDSMELTSIPNFKGGEGITDAKMFFDGMNRIMLAKVRPDSSIGLHTHDSGSEIMFFLSGTGVAVCDGKQEDVSAGKCHYCPKGSSHTVVNTGRDDLVMYCVVSQQ
ncbi:MAG: cupin domain-containing protein [Candidatus Methanomethylophilaceae archaeon]|nr:cupin domain-containing protein [Candidatus Methanomethylophilaceae archaeon]